MLRSFSAVAVLLLAATGASANPFVSTSGGGRAHVCALDADGETSCATFFAFDRLQPPPLPALSSITAGSVHTCGLDLAGTAVCWGDNDFGQLNVPPGETFVSLDAGHLHTCGITTDDRAVCWGLSDNGRLDLLDRGTGFLAVDAGQLNTCAVELASEIVCVGATPRIYSPAASDADIYGVALIDYPSTSDVCALYGEGRVECDGDRYRFDGRYTDVISVHRNGRMCALRTDATLECQLPADGRYGFAPERVDQGFDEDLAAVNAAGGWLSVSGGIGLCGVDVTGAVQCPGYSGTVPGSQSEVARGPENLIAAIYSDSTVELLWDIAPGDGADVAGADVFRDGVLVSSSFQSRSYLDRSLEPGVSYTYEVRTFSEQQVRSETSAFVTVDTGDRSATTTGPDDGYRVPTRPAEPLDLVANRYSSSTLELIWTRSGTSVFGHEIRRDGAFYAFTNGSSFLDTAADEGAYYEVLAVDRDGTILGVASVLAE